MTRPEGERPPPAPFPESHRGGIRQPGFFRAPLPDPPLRDPGDVPVRKPGEDLGRLEVWMPMYYGEAGAPREPPKDELWSFHCSSRSRCFSVSTGSPPPYL